LKAAVVEAMRATFTANYPEPDFRNIWISIEYPIAKASYPGLWIDYSDSDELRVAGLDHHEYIALPDGPHRVTRWRFGGEITVTVVALSSLERDRLFDEVVRTFAFARENLAVSEFRTLIEQNDLMAMNINFDTLRVFGDSAAPGTPWETEVGLHGRDRRVRRRPDHRRAADPLQDPGHRLPRGNPRARLPRSPPGRPARPRNARLTTAHLHRQQHRRVALGPVSGSPRPGKYRRAMGG